MKEGFDKEIDSLLRRHVRGAAGARVAGDGPAAPRTDVHLDADELGAFAEGALPAAARLAAVSHLADCDECRGVAVGLARVAVGAAEPEQKGEVVPASAGMARPAAWRAWASTLFAPRVLRFAAPVLALSLVAVVSFIALRTKDGGPLRAARNRSDQSEVVKERAGEGAPATTTTANANAGLLAEPGDNNTTRDPAAAGASPQASAGRGGHGTAEAPIVADVPREDTSTPPPPPAPAAVAAGPAEMTKAAPAPAAPEESEIAKAENRDKSDNNKEKSARAAEPVEEVAVNDLATQQRGVARSRVNEVQMPDGGARSQKRSADNNASNVYGGVGSGAAAAPKESERERTAPRAETARRGRSIVRPEQKAGEDEGGRGAETRSAAGHRFRREGSAWVDVNYKPSMPSTGVRRGTEAFRALVADIPVVGRVAEQIGGEVVVVVSGRAYRIR